MGQDFHPGVLKLDVGDEFEASLTNNCGDKSMKLIRYLNQERF